MFIVFNKKKKVKVLLKKLKRMYVKIIKIITRG